MEGKHEVSDNAAWGPDQKDRTPPKATRNDVQVQHWTKEPLEQRDFEETTPILLEYEALLTYERASFFTWRKGTFI